MSLETLVTRAPGGENERVVRAGDIQIPDLWAIARFIQRQGEAQGGEARQSARDMALRILEAWGIAHDLLRHVHSQPDLSTLERLTIEGAECLLTEE
jgi:hypothetical protein